MWTDIESADRAAGRMVVWVDADAEVSTASTRNLSQPLPKTSWLSAFSTSLLLAVRNPAPWNACAAIDTMT